MTCKDCKKSIHQGDNAIWLDTENSSVCDSHPTQYHHPLILKLADWRVGDQYACIGNGLFVRTRARKNRRG